MGRDAIIQPIQKRKPLFDQVIRKKHVEVGFITVHAQDHLMTTLLLKDIISTLIDVYKK